jgi:hypothetical protein
MERIFDGIVVDCPLADAHPPRPQNDRGGTSSPYPFEQNFSKIECQEPTVRLASLTQSVTAPLKMEGPMRPLIMIAATVLVIAIGYTVKTAIFPSATVYSLAATTAPTTLSPHEIHLNYKGIKDLPVHDSTNAH